MTIFYQDCEIFGETITISKREATILGPNLLFSKCKIKLETNQNSLTIAACRFQDCVIEATNQIVNVRWCNAWIERCHFVGIFRGCDFGNWQPDYDKNGGIKDSDFKSAVLDGCRFFGDYIKTINLPSWPCFNIYTPKQAFQRLVQFEWPGKHSHWISGLDWDPEEARLLVVWAPGILKQFGGSEDELRHILFLAGIISDEDRA